jgi:hypothetical protein
MDYRSASLHDHQYEAPKERGLVREYWWLKKEGERGACLVSTGKQLDDDQSARHEANLRHARMYENIELDSLSGVDFALAAARQSIFGAGYMSLNIAAAAIDTLAAKVAKNKPRPSFVTSGGDWLQQMKARRLDKWARGVFYETKAYLHGQHAFFDACVYGSGFLYLYPDEDHRIAVERVLPDEIFVDENDGRYGAPQQLIRRRVVPRERVLARYGTTPELRAAISTASVTPEAARPQEALMDMVEVWEGWKLPSSSKVKDGLFVVGMGDLELHCEPWKVSRFPFVKLDYKKRTVGYWGKGVAESLMTIQVELNRTVRSISEQIRRKGKGRTFVQRGSKVRLDHLTNGVGDIIEYTGTPPVVDNANAVSPEEFAYVDRLYAAGFREVGVSELSAQAKKPSGLDAAVALREYSDIESERFALVHQAWENFFLEFAETAIALIKDQWRLKGYKVKLPARQYAYEIDWNEVDLDRDSYVMQMFPVSSLPQTPAARYARVQEMLADGFIDKAVAQRLLDYPDIEAENNLGNAAIDDVDWTISKILDQETPELMPVEPYQNLDMLISRATAAYLQVRHLGCPEDRLAMLRDLIANASQLMSDMAAPAPVPVAPQAPLAPPPGAAMSGAPQMGDMNVNIQGGPAPVVAPAVA